METPQGSAPEPGGESSGWQPAEPPAPTPEAPPPAAVPPAAAAPPPAAPPSSSGGWQQPPESPGPAPGYRFAPHPGRLVAYIVDAIIVGLVSLVLLIIAITALGLGFSGNINDPSTWSMSGTAVFGFIFTVLLIFVITFGYFPWFWYRGGQTPGMRLFNLRVVRDADGGPISGGTALVRYLGYLLLFGINVIGLIGFGWILVDARRRGWHDLLAGTCVVQPER